MHSNKYNRINYVKVKTKQQYLQKYQSSRGKKLSQTERKRAAVFSKPYIV